MIESTLIDPILGYRNSFPNPFFDIANTFIPQDLRKTFQWCEYLYFSNGIVRSATMRVAQYFVTELKYNGEEKEVHEKIKKIYANAIPINNILINAAIDTIVYGNSFSVIYLPFRRFLVCKACHTEYDAQKFPYDFSGFQFKGKCPCGYSGEFTINDKPDKSPDKLNIIRIDPKQVVINYDMISGRSEYFWDVPMNIITAMNEITSGVTNKLVLNTMPQELIKCVKEQRMFKFNNDLLLHIKNPSLSGVSPQWGFPSFLTIMKLNYYNAVLRRANESIALDFVVPFRVISPAVAGNLDPIAMFSMKQFVSEMQSMVARHRIDPADIMIAPFPLNYQAFGAEKKALDVTQEIRAVNEEQLHALNYPSELFFNTLQIQALPAALRLFENNWCHLVRGLNAQLQWITNHICRFMDWDLVDIELTKVTTADDIEKRQVLMQLAAANQISMMSALKPYGIDYKEEQENLAYQAKIMQDLQVQLQEQQAQEQQLAGAPAGGTPGAGVMSPFDVIGQATQLAQNMLSMPYEQRKSQLMALKQQNPTMHAMVKQKMEEMRQQSKSQQGMQNMAAMGMMGPMTPGGGGMPPGGGAPPQGIPPM